MIQKVQWDRITNFTGRNGMMKCAGIELMTLSFNNMIILSALTSKGVVGRCDITIPAEALEELIVKLSLIGQELEVIAK